MKKLMKVVLGAWCLVPGAWSLVLGGGVAMAADLPAGYRAVEWIESTKGGKQFIDTGYTANGQTKVEFDAVVPVRWMQGGEQEDRFGVLFGSRTMDVWAEKAFALQMCDGNTAVDTVRFAYNGAYRQDGGKPFPFGERVMVTCDSQHVEWTGSKAASVSFTAESLASSKSTLYIFADNSVADDGAKSKTGLNHSVMRLYSFKIYEGGTLKRDFVPCVCLADAVAGLYDTVEGKFYGNAGSGGFATAESSLPFGRELTSGTYEITESFGFVAQRMESALKIADGATVTLNLAAGVTATLRGGDAYEVWGAGAGIEVPANATLKVTGAGRLVARGGKAANGANGVNGGNGNADRNTGNFTSGAGGAGGWGGGGAGAGIGGHGANGGGGGNGGKSVTGYNWSYTDISGQSGDNGGNGKNGGTCGTVSVEGTVKVFVTGGVAGTADGAGGIAGEGAWTEGSTYFFGGWGGGGGGSGAKGGAAQDIGGGGAGGYGGGGGGSGGYLSRFKWDTFINSGVNGGGGAGAANGMSGAISDGFFRYYDFAYPGGAKGVAGARGGSGTITVAESAVVASASGESDCYSVGRVSATEYILWEGGKLYRVVEGVRTEELPYSVVDTNTSSLVAGWYVVKGTVSRGNLGVDGAASLVLLRGSSLTASGGFREAGISVLSGKILGIFGAEDSSLTARGGYNGAGIGGAYSASGRSGGTVIINGGTVTATGGDFGAGIGGGMYGAGGTVTINGGTVTAIGGGSGAGIGGGYKGFGCVATINGGVVTARGGFQSAGIGGGSYSAGREVTINGGTVTATGGESGAGIGGGRESAGGIVTINGGTVTATGGKWGSGIGGGSKGAGGTVTIDGGSVKTKSISGLPKNSAGQRLYKVTVKGLGDLGGLGGLEGYGTRDVYPIDGCLYLYLPDGAYLLHVTTGGITKSASFVVMGDDVSVVLGETGTFFINGEDFSVGSGIGWNCSDNRLVLSNSISYVLSGITDVLGIEITGDAVVVLSNATITTTGKPALSVADGKRVNLQMSGLTSYLFATNAPAIALGNNAKLTVGSAPGADQLATIAAVSYDDEVYAISGATASTEVESGCFLVRSDVRAAEGTFGISEPSACPLLMKAGPTPDAVRFADTYNGEAFVGVVQSYAITVPSFEGVASVVVSNDIEELKGVGGVYRAMLTEEVTIDFTAVEGYEIVDNAHIYIPSLTNDVTVGEGDCPRPDVRRRLTVTLPETVEGLNIAVWEGEVEGEGKKVCPVRSGYDVEIVCTAQEGWRIISTTNVVTFANIQENKVLTAVDLPQVRRAFTVTVPEVENAYYDLSSTDARMERTGEDAAIILSNSEVTVRFVAYDCYRITANGEKTWTLTGDVTFGTTDGFPLPTVEGIPGTVAAPWTVGEGVQAYTNRTGNLTITGTGAMDDFASAADIPWEPKSVTSVEIGEDVTALGRGALSGLSDEVTISGAPLSIFRKVAPACASAEFSGAISGAEFERIDIVDGKAYLGVSVYTNSEVKAKGEGEGWGVATNGVIEVPAPGKQGFFYLKSKPPAPSNLDLPPIVTVR